jgi:hypothetical protein
MRGGRNDHVALNKPTAGASRRPTTAFGAADCSHCRHLSFSAASSPRDHRKAVGRCERTSPSRRPRPTSVRNSRTPRLSAARSDHTVDAERLGRPASAISPDMSSNPRLDACSGGRGLYHDGLSVSASDDRE